MIDLVIVILGAGRTVEEKHRQSSKKSHADPVIDGLHFSPFCITNRTSDRISLRK